MRRRRTLLAGTLGVGAIALCADPVAAQSINRRLFEDLNTQLLYVALPLALFVEAILVYGVLRFRDNDDPQPTASDPALELTWTVATGIILLFVGISAYVVLGNPYISGSPDRALAEGGAPEDTVNVTGVAYQWQWRFRYAQANVTTQNLLVLPRGADVVVRVTSRDVVHSLFVPAFGVKKDAFPGEFTTVVTRPTERGRYRLYCTEFCGAGHARMQGTVVVVDAATYSQWLETHGGEQNVSEAPTVTAASNASASG